jgi:hypothetical protein
MRERIVEGVEGEYLPPHERANPGEPSEPFVSRSRDVVVEMDPLHAQLILRSRQSRFRPEAGGIAIAELDQIDPAQRGEQVLPPRPRVDLDQGERAAPRIPF